MRSTERASDWQPTKLRYQLRLNPPVPTELRAASDIEISFLSMDAIGDDGSIRLDTVRPISELLSGYSYFENNDVLLAKVTPCFENGKGALLQDLPAGAGFGTTEVTVLRPSQTLDSKYLFYLTAENRFKQGGVASLTGAGGLKRVPDSYVKGFELALPEVAEQRQIADYLDAHTAKIDALIEKQERLIETLAERRQAVISHAVTKGLDPNAPMNDSGVDWLGSAPSSWSVLAIRHVATVGGGFTFESEDFRPEGAMPVVKQGDLFESDFTTFTNRVVASQFIVRSGDVLVAMSGNFKSVLWSRGRAALNQRSAFVRAKNGGVTPQWLSYSLPFVLTRLERLNASTTIKNLSTSELLGARIGVPSIGLQEQIVRHLDRETAQIHALSSKAREMIDVLKERRQALISAAVTGKIDVRGLS